MAIETANPSDLMICTFLMENLDVRERGRFFNGASQDEIEAALAHFPDGPKRYVQLYRARTPDAEHIQGWAMDFHLQGDFPLLLTPWGLGPTSLGVSLRGGLFDAAGPIKKLRSDTLAAVKNPMGDFTGSNSEEILHRVEKKYEDLSGSVGGTANPAFQGNWQNPEFLKHILSSMVAYRLDGWLYENKDGQYREVKTFHFMMKELMALDPRFAALAAKAKSFSELTRDLKPEGMNFLNFEQICDYLVAGHTRNSIVRCAQLPEFALITAFLLGVLKRFTSKGPDFSEKERKDGPDANWYRILGAKFRGTLLEPIYWLHAACWEDLWERRMLTRKMVEGFFERYGFLGTNLSISKEDLPKLPEVQTPAELAAYLPLYHNWIRDQKMWEKRMLLWGRRADSEVPVRIKELRDSEREITDGNIVSQVLGSNIGIGLPLEERQELLAGLGNHADTMKQGVMYFREEGAVEILTESGKKLSVDEVEKIEAGLVEKGVPPDLIKLSPRNETKIRRRRGYRYLVKTSNMAHARVAKVVDIHPKVAKELEKFSPDLHKLIREAVQEIERGR